MERSLQSRKRQLVRDAIYESAIDLFATKGFDETTVEELAEAAGISRRSFFRYFQSKDDLLALNTVNCGNVLREDVESCPSDLGPLEVLRETVAAGIRFTEAQQLTRQIIEITVRSTSARQAHMSRLMEVHDGLSSAYSGERFDESSQDFLRSHLPCRDDTISHQCCHWLMVHGGTQGYWKCGATGLSRPRTSVRERVRRFAWYRG